MPNIEQLKAKAKQLEAKQNWKAAITAWAEVLAIQESGQDPEAHDLSLYNRLGDLYLKIGDPATGADYFERAVEHYADTGFENNAIALCNKVLRYAPGRTHIYLKLAKLMAQKGFTAEAKLHFLQYAERMQRAGQQEEAVSALRELTYIAPNAAELTALLDQFDAGAGRGARRGPEPVEPEYDVEAEAPKAAKRKTRSLVFLDVDDVAPPGAPPRRSPAAPTPAAAGPPPVSGLPLLHTGEEKARGVGRPPEFPRREEHERFAPPGAPSEPEFGSEQVLPPAGFEGTEFVGQVPEVPPLDVEFTSLSSGEQEAPGGMLEDLISHREEFDRVPGDSDVLGLFPGLRMIDPEPVAPLEGLQPTSAETFEAEAPPTGAGGENGWEGAGGEGATETLTGGPPPSQMGEGLLGGMRFVEASGADALEVRSGGREGAAGPTQEMEPEAEVPEAGSGDLLAAAAEVREAAAAGPATPEAEPVPARVGPETVEELEERILDEPDNPELHRLLGEALVETGDRARGLEELAIALRQHEERGDFGAARELGQEISRLEPNNIRALQKMVEISYRGGDRGALVTAYLELADALFRNGALSKSLAVYERVLEHDPQNTRAHAAMGMLRPPEEPKARAADAKLTIRSEAPAGAADFVDLAAMLLEGERRTRDTRMRIEEEAPTGDEARDFAEMLEQFRKGIGENLGDEDYQAHYDLGVAFKEMGLLDDAIAEFQKAMRGPAVRLKTHEALGVCFFDKGQYSVAEAILRRALDFPAADDQERIGILYWLARALEEEERLPEALALYRRVFAVNIRFEDVGSRVRALAQGSVR